MSSYPEAERDPEAVILWTTPNTYSLRLGTAGVSRETTLIGFEEDGEFTITADSDVDELRSEIWSTIHSEKGDLPWADVAYALGVVQYELMHHADELEDE